MEVPSLLVNEALSTKGENITIIADAKTSISLLRKQAAPKMSQASYIDSKTLHSVVNSLIADQANTITCNLETSFGQTWSEVFSK